MNKVEKKVNAGVAVIIKDNLSRVLMGKRKGSHGAGTWSFPGGWINTDDATLEDAARREVFEETGMHVADLAVVDATYTHFGGEKCSVTVMMVAGVYSGNPITREPDKLDGEWTWVRLDQLPTPLFEPLLASSYMKRLCD